MRYVFLLGGLCGFALGAGTAFWFGRSPERVLLDGACGCLAGALLFRWLWNVLLSGLRDALEARQQAATATAPAAAGAEPARRNPASPS